MADDPLDCPECEICCALGICCPPGSPQHRAALTTLILSDATAKLTTDVETAQAIANAVADLLARHITPRDYAALRRHIQALIAKG